MNDNKTRYLVFDILRALAIIFIVVGHLPGYLVGDVRFPAIITVFGMSLFIFISGYLICENNRVMRTVDNILNFYRKRVIRIYPLYLLAIASFVIGYIILLPPLSIEIYNPVNILVNVAGAQIILSPLYATVLPVLHFVGLILVFYLIYPFLLINSKSVKDLVVVSIFILMVFIGLREYLGIIDPRFFQYYLVFIFGVICSYVDVLHNKLSHNESTLLIVAFLISLCLYVIFPVHIPIEMYMSFPPTSIQSILYLIFINDGGVELAVTFSLVMVMVFNWLSLYIDGTLKQAVGIIAVSSYMVFLFHAPVLRGCSLIAQRLPLNPMVINLLIIVVAIPIMFYACYWIQRTEQKMVSRIHLQ